MQWRERVPVKVPERFLFQQYLYAAFVACGRSEKSHKVLSIVEKTFAIQMNIYCSQPVCIMYPLSSAVLETHLNLGTGRPNVALYL